MDIVVRKLTMDLKDAYLYFFDNMVFDENPDRLKCYCYDFHFLGDVESCTRAQSRSAVMELISTDNLKGYLAFKNEKVIGWCNANDRSNYQRLIRDYDFVDNQDDKVCSIVCFLIHPEYRRQGIAQSLLEKIITDSTNKSFDYFEAYPKKSELSCEGNFKGPLELYKRFDFNIHREYNNGYVMRKEIK